jgi:DnaJ-class molecular chaperone
MEYALKVLNRCGSAVRSTRRKRFVDEVSCAYCGGGGADPKYRSASGCPVCRGAGVVRVIPPVVFCRQCGSSGRMGGDLICLNCKVVGVVSVRLEAET